MVRRVRVPAEWKHRFTANELCGWPDSVAYSPDVKTAKPPRPVVICVTPAPVRVSIGRKLA